MASLGKTIYLPPVYDSKKLRAGIVEIINFVQNQRLKRAEEASRKEGPMNNPTQ